jgi:hypothetical protein
MNMEALPRVDGSSGPDRRGPLISNGFSRTGSSPNAVSLAIVPISVPLASIGTSRKKPA